MAQCGGSLADALISGQFWDAVVCTFSEPMGGVVIFGLFVWGGVGAALYLFSGSAIIPLSLTLILGSVVVTQLPGPAVQLVGVLGLLVIAGALYYLVVSRGPARP